MSAGRLEAVAARIGAGAPLTDEDAEALAATPDIIGLGMLAEEASRRRHEGRVTFLRVAHVTVRDASAQTTLPAAAGEIRLAGEAATLADAVTAARAIAGRAGAIPVSAFSLEQVARWSDAQGVPLERGLTQLKEAGLASIAGVSIDGGLDVARALEAASRAGMTVARIGFDGPGRDWLAQLWALSASADAARSVRALAPLPQGGDPAAPTTGYEDLKRVALARLLARSTDTIQVSWALYGPKLAQVALAFGADDLDDVAAADPPGTGPRRATLEEVRRNIGAAGLTPVERNGRWEPVRSTDD